MLAVSRGEVPSSEEISVVDSITVDWVMAPRNWGFNLKSNSTTYPDHGHHGDPRPTRKNSHGRAGNRTRDLVVSSQKLWPPDHEAGHFQKVCRSVWLGIFMTDRHQDSHVLQILIALQVLSLYRTFQNCLHWRLSYKNYYIDIICFFCKALAMCFTALSDTKCR